MILTSALNSCKKLYLILKNKVSICDFFSNLEQILTKRHRFTTLVNFLHYISNFVSPKFWQIVIIFSEYNHDSYYSTYYDMVLYLQIGQWVLKRRSFLGIVRASSDEVSRGSGSCPLNPIIKITSKGQKYAISSIFCLEKFKIKLKYSSAEIYGNCGGSYAGVMGQFASPRVKLNSKYIIRKNFLTNEIFNLESLDFLFKITQKILNVNGFWKSRKIM